MLEMPSLLFMCHEARGVMYDALLSFHYATYTENDVPGRRNVYRPVPRGEDVHVFTRDSCSQANQWACPQIFGWRIMDIRYSGLREKVKEEKKWLGQLRKELMQVQQQKIVDPEKAAEGYVRLTLHHPNGSTKTVVEGDRTRYINLYPTWKQECKINMLCRSDD